jgi:hypothetical protein
MESYVCRLVAVSDIKWMVFGVASHPNARKESLIQSKASCVCGDVAGAMAGLWFVAEVDVDC